MPPREPGQVNPDLTVERIRDDSAASGKGSTQRAVSIVLPNSASLHTLRHLLTTASFFPLEARKLELVLHPKGTHLQPFVIAMLGAWASYWREAGATLVCRNGETPSARYAVRMGLFDALGVEAPATVTPHEPTGRFIPLQRLASSNDVKNFIADTVPLLHSRQHQQAVLHCLSELTRNVIEHAGGVPAFACAQYYEKAQRVSLGVADAGIGIRESLSTNYTFTTDEDAIMAALKPGVSGAAPRIYGSPDNAGAGLFFTKAIAQMSGGSMAIYSGSAAYRLRRHTTTGHLTIYGDPKLDRHDLFTGLPRWHGTVIGVDISSDLDDRFDRVLSRIRTVYSAQSPRRSKPKINFT